MAKSNQITVKVCPSCGKEYKDNQNWGYCVNHEYPTRPKLETRTRDKQRVGGDFVIAGWFSSRSSAGLVLEHKITGERFDVYMSDLFEHLKGQELSGIVLEEAKKGTAFGWKVVSHD